MIFKYSFIILAVSVAYLTADPALCPNPDKAKHLAHEEEVHIEASSFGRTENVVVIPGRKLINPVTCLTLTEDSSAKTSGSVSITSIGLTESEVTIKLVSQIQKGIDVIVSAYTE